MTEKYKRIINNNEKNIAAKDALKFLNYLKTKCSEKIVVTLLENYVERQIEITDRGVLVKAIDEFYSFVIRIEEVARSFMTVDLLTKNQNEDIREIWVSLSRKMPNRQ